MTGREAQEIERSGTGRWRDWYLVAILFGVVAYCFGPGLFGQRVLLEVNYLTTRYPWVASGGNQDRGHEALATDTIDAWVPSFAYIRKAIFSGHLPNWQGLVGGGAPIGSLPDSAQLSPLSLPFWVLPLWLAPAFVILLTFVVGVGGTFLFLRRLRVGRPAALVAGLVFATSGFMVMWTNWPQVRVACLIPALLWATERVIQRARPLDVVLVAIVTASMIFGGFPAVTGWTLYLGIGYFIFRMAQRHRFALRQWAKPTLLAAGGLVLGALLSMLQLLPFVSFYEQHGFQYRAGLGAVGLPVSSLITAIAPNAYGLGVYDTRYYGPSNPVEVVAYVGAAAVVLAVSGAALGVRRTDRSLSQSREGQSRAQQGIAGYFLLATVVILAVGWGPAAIQHVTQHLPVFSGNFVGRIRSVLGFTVAVLAGFGFDRLTTSLGTVRYRRFRDRFGQPRRWLFAALPSAWSTAVWAVSALALLFVLWRAIRSVVIDGNWHDFAHATWIPFLLLAAAVLLVIGSRLLPHGGSTAMFIVLPLLVAAQGAQFFHTVLPHDSRENFYPVTGTHQYLKTHIGHDRFASSGGTMYPTTGLYYDLRTPTGHAFQDPKWIDLLRAIDPNVQQSPTSTDFSSSINQTNIGDQPLLDQMGVKYFVLPPGDVTGTTKPLPAAHGSMHITSQTDATCTLPGEPLRGVQFQAADAVVPANPANGTTLKVTVRDGAHVLSSGTFTNAAEPAGSVYTVGLAGENLPTGGTATVTISETGSSGGINLATNNGRVICSPVTPAADHLKLVYADPGSLIYQRLTALPRIHWTAHTTIIHGLDNQIAALEQGIPPNDVILPTGNGSSSGQPATIHINQDAYNTIQATVHAQGAGHLVIADALQQPGWSATLDGKPTTLLPANGAMVAVAVPQGAHVITLHYHAPGQKPGAAISTIALIIALTLLGWEWRHRGRRRDARKLDDTQK